MVYRIYSLEHHNPFSLNMYFSVCSKFHPLNIKIFYQILILLKSLNFVLILESPIKSLIFDKVILFRLDCKL